jgi:K+-transporting ATPase ATPase C chain
MPTLVASLRLVLATLLVCVAGYTAAILGFAQLVTPESAQGSLITRADGSVVGSRLLAQKFTSPRYFWPRPSAVDYNAAGAGGSNKSPTSPDLTARAQAEIERHGASAERPLPDELAAASGGGLDPHLTERAALYQAPRVAVARALPVAEVEELVRAHGFHPGGALLTPERLVDVLELNLALDERARSGVAR